MYYYIYDSFVNDRRYKRILDKIETRLTDLDISGEIAKITPIRTIKDSIEIGIEKGYKTFVMVGNDYLVTSALDILIDKDITFGIIPIGSPNYIADILGIPNNERACEILSRRIIERVDVGKANGKYFLTSCDIGFESNIKKNSLGVRKRSKLGQYRDLLQRALSYKSVKIFLEIDNKYKAISEVFIVSVINIKKAEYRNLKMKYINISPKDGILDVIVIPSISKSKFIKDLSIISKKEYDKLPNISYFKAQKIRIESSEKNSICIDGQIYEKLPCEIKVIPNKLKVVVGRGRKF